MPPTSPLPAQVGPTSESQEMLAAVLGVGGNARQGSKLQRWSLPFRAHKGAGLQLGWDTLTELCWGIPENRSERGLLPHGGAAGSP